MSSNIELLEALNMFAAVVIVAMLLSILANRMRKRAYSMKIAAEALREHYAEMERIVSDPAVPHNILNFVTDFSEAVSEERVSRMFIDVIMSSRREKSSRDDRYSVDLHALVKTRPDLVEAIYKAVSKGMVAMLFRINPSQKQIDDFLAGLATDPKRELQVASKYVSNRPREMRGLVAA